MRPLLIATILLLAPFAGAEVLQLDTSVRYKKDFTKSYVDFPAAFDAVMSKRAFIKLVGNNSGQPISTLDLMARVFIPRTFSRTGDTRMAFALSGLRVPDSVHFNEIYEVAKGHVIHLRTVESGDVALYFENIDLSVVQEFKSDLVNAQKVVAHADKQHLFYEGYRRLVPQAFAQNPSYPNIDYRSIGRHFAPPALCGGERKQTVEEKKSEAGLLQNIWGCSKGLAAGVWDATGGAAWFVVSGIGNAIISPVETLAKVGGSLFKVADLVSDLGGAFGDLKDTYTSLPTDVKAKIGCELAGTIGTTALIWNGLELRLQHESLGSA